MTVPSPGRPDDHLAELRRRVGRVDLDDLATVSTAGLSWGGTADALAAVRTRLEEAAPQMVKGFGDSEVGRAGQEAFLTASRKIRAREDELRLVADRLTVASDKLAAAYRTAHGAPAEPGPIPAFSSGYGETTDEQTRLHAHTQAVKRRELELRAYGEAEQEAGQRVEELTIAYADTTAAMELIHGDPDSEPPPVPETRVPRGREHARPEPDTGPHQGSSPLGGIHPGVLAGGGAVAAGLLGVRALLGGGASTRPAAGGAARAGVGAPVTRGGRGARSGGRAGLAGGRGRRKDDRPDRRDRDLFDDGSDWIDDEQAGPAVLGRIDD